MARGIPQTVPDHACMLPGFSVHGKPCSACEKERYREKEKPQLKLFRGTLNSNPSINGHQGCHILVLAIDKEEAKAYIQAELRRAHFDKTVRAKVAVSEVVGPFVSGRVLCRIVHS